MCIPKFGWFIYISSISHLYTQGRKGGCYDANFVVTDATLNDGTSLAQGSIVQCSVHMPPGCTESFNTLRPILNGQSFADDNFSNAFP